jgi:hypothetical protein
VKNGEVAGLSALEAPWRIGIALLPTRQAGVAVGGWGDPFIRPPELALRDVHALRKTQGGTRGHWRSDGSVAAPQF